MRFYLFSMINGGEVFVLIGVSFGEMIIGITMQEVE